MKDYFSKYSQEFIKELELEYPGPYTVYHYEKFPVIKKYPHGFKIGCTNNLVQRNKTLSYNCGKKLSLPKVVVETNSLLTAARIERELSLELGIVGQTDYINDLNRVRYIRSKEVQNKRVANTDWKALSKKRVANTDWKARNAKMDYKAIAAKKDYKAIMSHRQRGIIAIDPEGNRTVYSGMTEAARQLTNSTGIKFNSGGISTVCNPKEKATRHKGYKFEYA